MITDYSRFIDLMEGFGVLLNVEDNYGETIVYVGGIQDRGSTEFIFETDTGKFLRYSTPLVDNCLTRRM